MQRCYAAILFTDLCSATSLCETIDPEFYAEIISQIRKISEETIDKHKGLLNQFYGDGVLAAFGFPTPREDAIYQATIAALELHKRVRSAKRHAELPKNFNMKMHSGIDAGYIVADTGDHIQGRYKFAGDALNTAARLSNYASEDEILVGKITLQHELPFFVTEKVENIKLRGKEKAISAYKVLGTSDVKTRFEAREQMGLTPFIGRKFETRKLKTLLSRSKLGKFNQINITGEAGVGKSRLVSQFLSSSFCNSCNIYQTFCLDSKHPLFPIRQFLSHVFAIDNGTKIENMHAKIAAKLKMLELDSQSIRKQLLSFLEKEKYFCNLNTFFSSPFTEAFAKILRSLSLEKTVLLIIEDYHLVDKQTKLAISSLSQRLKKSRVLILTCSRPDTTNAIPNSGENLSLFAFNHLESGEVINHLLPKEKNPKKINSIIQFSGGNPLFIEESCKILAKNSFKDYLLEIEPDDFISNKMKSGLAPQLLWMIAQRVRRLPEKLLETIDCAAVIGEHMEKKQLENLCGHRLSREEIDLLADNGLLFKLEDTATKLTFRGGLTRSAIYQSINYSKRKSLHGRYAKILESQDPSEKNWEALALNHEKAENNVTAGKYYAIAANKAMESTNYERARLYFVNALDNLDPEINKEITYHQWVVVLLQLARVCLYDASPDYLRYFQRAVKLAKKYSDHSGRVKSQLWLGYVYYALGNSTQAIKYSSKVLKEAQSINDKASTNTAIVLQAQSYIATSNYSRASQLFSMQSFSDDEYSSNLGRAYSLACMAFSHADQGRFKMANRQFECAINLAEGSEIAICGSVFALFSASKLWEGNWKQAKSLAEESRNHSLQLVSPYVFAMANAIIAYAEWKQTHSVELITTVFDATTWLNKHGKKLFLSLPSGWLCEMYTHSNQPQKARQFAALALWRSRAKDYFGQSLVYRCLATLSAHSKQKTLTKKYLLLALRSAKFRTSPYEEKQTLALSKQLGVTIAS